MCFVCVVLHAADDDDDLLYMNADITIMFDVHSYTGGYMPLSHLIANVGSTP